MPSIREKLLADLEQDFWSAEVVALAIAAKQQKRNLKGEMLNAFVLKTNYGANYTIDQDELAKFLTTLRSDIQNISDSHFQIMVQTGAHWTPLDIKIKNGELSVFSVDAVGEPVAAEYIKEILKHFPQAKIFNYCPYDEKNKETEFKLQFDENSCSHFSLDHLFHLAKSDYFEKLDKATFRKVMFSENEYKVTPSTIPVEMAWIFRDMQSMSRVQQLPMPLKQQTINKKQQTLMDSVETHTKKINANKSQNLSIDYKRAEFVKDINDFINHSSDEDLKSIIEKRTGTRYLQATAEQRQQLDKEQVARLPLQVVALGALNDALSELHAKGGKMSFFSGGLGNRLLIRELNNMKEQINKKDDASIIAYLKTKIKSKSLPSTLVNRLVNLTAAYKVPNLIDDRPSFRKD